MNTAHQIRLACIGIVAVAAIAALVILFSLAGRHATGAVAADSYICPLGFKPVLVEGSGRWAQEVALYQEKGGYCTFGPDGITPCCTRP